MKNSFTILILGILILVSCNKETITEEPTDRPSEQTNTLSEQTGTPSEQTDTSSEQTVTSSEPTLLFKSGFEGDITLTGPNDPLDPDNADYQFLRGTDSETGFDWPIVLDYLGVDNGGLHLVDVGDDGEAISNELVTTVGHDGTQTTALYSIENYIESDLCTQCPYELLDVKNGKRDLYIKYWMKIDSASVAQKKDTWRALFEYKTKDYDLGDGTGTGFRLIAFIYTDPEDGIPYWHWQGDADPEHPIWEIDNKSIPVPLNEWFCTEYYWHWSEGDDGRALWKINGEVVGDHYGPTTRNSKPIDFIILWQIYGDSNPKYQWIDDVEIWTGIPKVWTGIHKIWDS